MDYMVSVYLLIILTTGVASRFTAWNSWSACSAECGSGWSTRERITMRDDCYTELSERRTCEVTCGGGENVAINKTVSSSSVFLGAFPNSNAVDGNTNTDFLDGKSCMMTGKDVHPFVRIDLGKRYVINKVLVYNRMDCCSERLNNLVVNIGSFANISDSQECGKVGEMTNRSMTVVRCSEEIIGRYVQLSIPGPQFLSVCELQAFGKEAPDIHSTNIALGKHVTQSSTYSVQDATKANDGDYSTSSETLGGSSSHWWQMDLGKTMNIYTIRIFSLDSAGTYLKGSQLSIVDSTGTAAVIRFLNGNPAMDGSYYAYEFSFPDGISGQILKIDATASISYIEIREFEVYAL